MSSLTLARQEPRAPQFLVFEDAIVPISKVRKISWKNNTLEVWTTECGFFSLPYTAEQWKALKKVFLEGM